MKYGSPAKKVAFDYVEMSRVADRLLTPVAVIAPDTTLQYANNEVARLLDVNVSDLIGRRMLDFIHPDDQTRVTEELAIIALKDPEGGFSRFRLRGHHDQGWRVVDAYAHNLLNDPSVRGILISGGDVTLQENMARALKTFSDVTRILIHAKDEKSLMSSVCDSIIENGNYLVAWVGYARRDEDRNVQIVAASGLTECLASDLTRWDESDLGRGPTGEAIRTQAVQVVNDPQGSQVYDSWREQIEVYGVRSVCSLPLVIDNHAVGALTIYSCDPTQFGPDELSILCEYANELSFGMGRLRDMQRLLRNESQLREAERLTHVGHWEWDLQSDEMAFRADEIFAIYGTEPAEWSGTLQAFLDVVPVEERDLVKATLDHTVTAGTAELTHRIITRAGDVRYLHVRTEIVRSDDDTPVRVLGTSMDITEAKLAQQQIESSREFLQALTDNMSEGMIATDAIGTVTFVNAAARRLVKADASELLGAPATALFRLEPSTESGAVRNQELFEVWTRSTPLHVDQCSLVCRDGTTVPVALTASPLEAEGIKGSVIVFEDITSYVIEQLRVEQELNKLAWVGRIRDALDEDRLELFAQPVIDLATNEVVQHELLVRMRSASGELIEPAHFLPTAEEFGLITDIDRWVIKETARVASRGHRVAFNLSARSVADSNTLSRIHDAIRKAGARPDHIECEITETALVRDVAAAEVLVRGLISVGCSVALDDFGVGYGGFAYLKRLPVSVLKIDREFVRDLVDEASSQHVVAAVVSLAKAFGLLTTAEGPEKAETLEMLKELGVDHAQGYIIGRPTPLDEAFDDL